MRRQIRVCDRSMFHCRCSCVMFTILASVGFLSSPRPCFSGIHHNQDQLRSRVPEVVLFFMRLASSKERALRSPPYAKLSRTSRKHPPLSHGYLILHWASALQCAVERARNDFCKLPSERFGLVMGENKQFHDRARGDGSIVVAL
jgi:hypothetical protein